MNDEKDKKPQVDILEDEPTADDLKEKDKKGKKSKEQIEIETLRAENDKLFKEKDELNNKVLLALADEQNYKKRIDEEQSRFMKYATFDMCKRIVKTLDNFDFVIQKDQSDPTIIAYLEGFKMVRNSLYSDLEKEGVSEIEALGKEFDPYKMTSVQMAEDPEKKDQEVTAVLLKGYMFKDRVLRPATVVINSLPPQTKTETDENKKEEEVEATANDSQNK